MARKISVFIIYCQLLYVQGNSLFHQTASLSTKKYAKDVDTALVADPMLVFYNQSSVRCVILCEHHCGCLSVNFKDNDESTCDLFNVSSHLNGTQTKADPNTTYIELRLFYLKSCNDLYEGNHGERVYQIMLPKKRLIKAICISYNSVQAWTLLLKRFDGSVDFYRDWKSYKEGFGTLSGEFWIGLEAVHQLTENGKYLVRFEMKDGNGQFSYADYGGFKISSENKGYRLDFSAYLAGTADDGFRISKGQKFSTKDRDNDSSSSRACSIEFRSAGWFRDCMRTDIFSTYMPGDQATFYILRWSSQSKYKHGLSMIEMKVQKQKD